MVNTHRMAWGWGLRGRRRQGGGGEGGGDDDVGGLGDGEGGGAEGVGEGGGGLDGGEGAAARAWRLGRRWRGRPVGHQVAPLLHHTQQITADHNSEASYSC